MHTADVDATNLPVLRDVDGTPIPFQGRVQQVTVDEAHGHSPSGYTRRATPLVGESASSTYGSATKQSLYGPISCGSSPHHWMVTDAPHHHPDTAPSAWKRTDASGS